MCVVGYSEYDGIVYDDEVILLLIYEVECFVVEECVELILVIIG